MLAAAFVLLPTAQAFAHETLKVEIEGEGALVSAGPTYEGTPPIDCHSPTQLGDVCEDEMSDEGEGYEAVNLKALPASGWEFVEWVIVEGTAEACEEISGFNYCLAYSEPPGSGGATVKAVFAEEPGPAHETLKVEIEGEGALVSAGPTYEGTPPIDCHSPTQLGDVCEDEMSDEGEGYEAVNLKALPASGWEFVEWVIVEGTAEACEEISGFNYCLAYSEPPGSGGATVKAVFAEESGPPQPLTIEVEGDGEVTGTGITCTETGNGTAACEEEFAEGTQVPLTATADIGSHFVGWTTLEGDAGSCTAATASCETGELNAPAKLKAVFAENTQPLTIEVEGDGEVTGTGITCTETGNGTAACEEEFAEGTQVPLTATAETGWHFVGWTTLEGDAGSCTAATASCETGELNAPAKLKAVFAENPPRTLTITVEGSGVGAVACKEDSGPYGSCEVPFADGHEVTVKTTPAAGSHFAGFSAGTGSAEGCADESLVNPCTFTIEADSALAATFELQSHTLTVQTGGTGSGGVTCDGDACAASYPHGTVLTVAAMAGSGSDFVGWSGGGCSGTGACVVTIDADTTLTATFDRRPEESAPAPGPTRPAPAPAPGPTPESKGTASALDGTAQVNGRWASIKLGCTGTGPCKGTVKLFAELPQGTQGKKTKQVGRASFSIGKGRSKTLKIELSGAAGKELSKKGSLRARLKGLGLKSRNITLRLNTTYKKEKRPLEVTRNRRSHR